MRSVTASRAHARRSTNGHASRIRPDRVRETAKGWISAVALKFLLRKSVLIAIGLGTLASWYVKVRFFSPKPRRFGLF